MHPQVYIGRSYIFTFMLTGYEKGFLEGMIDADGCISIGRQKVKRKSAASRGWRPYVRLVIDNNNKEFLEKARSIIGYGHICNRTGRIWTYNVSHWGCKKLFPEIKLIVKEPRRLHAIKIFKHMDGKCGKGKKYTEKLEKLIVSRPPASVATLAMTKTL